MPCRAVPCRAVPCGLNAVLPEGRAPQVVQHLEEVEDGGGLQAARGLLRRGEGVA